MTCLSLPQPPHSQSQCDGVLLKYLRQFWNLAGLSKSPPLELVESWAGPRQLWQLAEESPQFQLSHYYPGPQVELLGGKVGDIFTQLSIVSAIVEQFVCICHTFLLSQHTHSTNILNNHCNQLK